VLIKRRDFIRYSGTVGAVAMGSGFARAASGFDYDVVIIGAGMAGMTAGRLLGRAGPGLKVLILEARDRVGGRMYTAPDRFHELSPHGIELGAQFIHGSKAATWELIKEFGLFTRSTKDFGEPEYRHFQPGQAAYQPDWQTIEQLTQRLRTAWDAYRGPDISYQAFVETLGLPIVQQEMLYGEAASWSGGPSRLSVKAVLLDGAQWDAYWDEDFQISGGYSRLAERLARGLAGQIQLSSKVTGVFWRHGLVGVTYDYRGTRTGLTTRRLISTLPIGVMQSGQVSIEPELPEWKQRAIDALEMGQVVVVQMQFSDPFLRQNLPVPGGFSTPDGDIYFGLPHPANPAGQAVTGWFSGSAAQQISDLGEEAGLKQILNWLGAAANLGKLQRKLKWYRYKDWITDPYSLGSYSITRPGGHGARETLSKPLQDTVFFAGEATAPPPHYQTVHGAYMSGQRVALEVSESLHADPDAQLTEDRPVILDADDAPIIELL